MEKTTSSSPSIGTPGATDSRISATRNRPPNPSTSGNSERSSALERRPKRPRFLERRGIHRSESNYWLSHVVGTVRGLRSDIETGYLTTVEEEAHADVFADFLEMSDHLVRSKLLLPAAVVSGAALEAHLRAITSKAGIATSSGGKPKRAGKLVIAWQDIRNDAAHGESEPAKSQVQNMTQGIRDFIARHPA